MSSIIIVREVLGGTSAITARVPKKSMFPIKWDADAQPPLFVINQVGKSDIQMLDGPASYFEGRVRLEFLAQAATDAVQIGELAEAALGAVVKQTVGAFVDVDIIFLSSFTDWADDRSLCRHISDYSVRYRSAG